MTDMSQGIEFVSVYLHLPTVMNYSSELIVLK